MANEPIFSFAALQNRLHIHGKLAAQTALRIGAGRSSDINGNDLPVLRDSLGAPFIPGASLKGVFRARIESLVQAVHGTEQYDNNQIATLSRKLRDIQYSQPNREQAELNKDFLQAISSLPSPSRPLDFNELEQRTAAIGALKQQNNNLADDIVSKIVWRSSSLIDVTFGSPQIAGRIFFKDALVDRALWFDQFEIRNGVALNRDTETVEQGLLYDYEVVPAGMRFCFELTLENAAPWQLGMVLLALRPWQAGDVQIGGFRSRGLGYVQLIDIKATYAAIEGNTPAARADAVLSMLGYGANSAAELPLKQPDERMQGWFAAFKQALINPQAAIEEGATVDA